MNTIGLIAGRGKFPFMVAEEIRKSGDKVFAVALKEEADPALERSVDGISWISLGEFQKLIDTLHGENISTALMVGRVKHSYLFANLKLDWRAVKLMASLLNKKTDSILGAVAAELAKENIDLLPSHHYLKHLLPKPGVLAGPKLSKEEKEDVEFGKNIAKQIAGLDIGQTVAVKEKAVLAVEAMEGTNECIKRAAQLGKENIVIVKVAKPNQDWRFDLPVVGIDTVQLMAECKARVLAIESGVTIMIDKDQLLEKAENCGISIIAL